MMYRVPPRYLLPRQIFRVCAVLCLALVLSSSSLATEKGYKFGVFPFLPPQELQKIFAPMATELSKALRKPVSFDTSDTFEKFIDRLNDQSFDIVFVQPFDYVTIADNYGYIPLATRNKALSAVIVALPDGPIKKLTDLRNRELALPPSVSAVSYLTKNHLLKHGIDPQNDITIVYRRSHISCLQQVLIRATDACSTAMPPLRLFENKTRTKLAIIDKTDTIPLPLFAAHPRISIADREIIQAAIISWGKTAEGKKLLERGKFTTFVKTSDADYDMVRKLKKQFQE